MIVKVKNKSGKELPKYQTSFSAGMDLHACVEEEIRIKPLERALIKTGLFLEIPQGYEAQIRSRSGLAIKNGVVVLNAPGTIDSDYRGEICVILINLSQEDFYIKDGDRIAQIVFTKHETVLWQEVDELLQTQRGESGFGSTGNN